MKNKITIMLGIAAMLMALGFKASAQLSEEVVKKTPELPGELMFDFGFNLLYGKPGYWDETHWFRSKSAAIYFVKPFDLTKNVEFRPGIGFSFEKYGSKNANFLDGKYSSDDDDWSYIKAQYNFNYVEAPIALQYNLRGNGSKWGPYINVGALVGVAFDQKTKVKYQEFGDKRKIKEKGDQGANKFRAGLQGRIGWGQINLFYKYYFTPVFSGSGPDDTQDMMSSTIGISITGF